MGLARCLAADAGALAKTELRRQELQAQDFAARATRAAAIALGGALAGLVGALALSTSAALGLEALGVPRALALAAVGLADIALAAILGRAARAAYAPSESPP